MRLTQVLSLMLMSFLLDAQILAQKICRKQKIQNGRMLLRDKGSKAIYKCKRGFNLVGHNTSECLETRWTPAPPACIASGPTTSKAVTTTKTVTVTTPLPVTTSTTPSATSLLPTSGPTTSKAVTTTKTVTVTTPLPVTTSTTPSATSLLPRTDIKCTPKEIPNGKVVNTKKRIVTFKCAEGYKMFGKRTVKCRPNGTWKGQLPRCVSAGVMPTTAFTTSKTMTITALPLVTTSTTASATSSRPATAAKISITGADTSTKFKMVSSPPPVMKPVIPGSTAPHEDAETILAAQGGLQIKAIIIKVNRVRSHRMVPHMTRLRRPQRQRQPHYNLPPRE